MALNALVGQARVLTQGGAFGVVQQIIDTPEGRFVLLANSSRRFHIPADRLDLLREPISPEEATAWMQALKSSAPFTGEQRRLQVRMAVSGTQEQRLAGLATALDWSGQAPPHEERAALLGTDPDWAASNHVLIPEIDGVFAELAYVQGIEASGLKLLDHFEAVRRTGSKDVAVTPPEAPPPPVSTHGMRSELGSEVLTTMELNGAVTVVDPIWTDDLAQGVAVDTVAGPWTLLSAVTPHPEFDEATWVALVRGTSREVGLTERPGAEHAPDTSPPMQIHLAGKTLPLGVAGVARVESGQLAFLTAPPETALRSIRFAPGAPVCVWPWGARFGAGGDGGYEVLVAMDESGVAAIVMMLAL